MVGACDDAWLALYPKFLRHNIGCWLLLKNNILKHSFLIINIPPLIGPACMHFDKQAGNKWCTIFTAKTVGAQVDARAMMLCWRTRQTYLDLIFACVCCLRIMFLSILHLKIIFPHPSGRRECISPRGPVTGDVQCQRQKPSGQLWTHPWQVGHTCRSRFASCPRLIRRFWRIWGWRVARRRLLRTADLVAR